MALDKCSESPSRLKGIETCLYPPLNSEWLVLYLIEIGSNSSLTILDVVLHLYQ